MALTYITNGKIVLPDSVVCGKALAFDDVSGKICGVVDTVPAGAKKLMELITFKIIIAKEILSSIFNFFILV